MNMPAPSSDPHGSADAFDCGAGLRESSRRFRLLYAVGLLALALWAVVANL